MKVGDGRGGGELGCGFEGYVLGERLCGGRIEVGVGVCDVVLTILTTV